ncbi:MAG: HAMP domain-containing protein, partial [Nitrospirota bacterium]
MFKFRSLATKYISISLIILAFIAIFVCASFNFTHHMKGEATKINLAGQMRFRSFEMAWLAQRIAERTVKTGTLPISFLTMELKQEMDMFDRAISDFKNGNKQLGLKPIKHYKKAEPVFDAIVTEWSNNLKPILLNLTELTEEVPEKEVRALLDRYDSRIQGYVEEINKLVKVLEEHYETEINQFDSFRIYTLGFFVLVSFFIIVFMRQGIIIPVKRLENAAKEMEEGIFDVRVDIKSRDEIGALGNTFNSMANAIERLVCEKIEHLNELSALNRLSSVVSSSLSVEGILNKALDEILNLEHLRIEKKGAIFLSDEKSGVLKLEAHRGFSEEFARLEATIPFGECLCGIAAKTGEIIVSDDCYKDERHTRKYPEMVKHGHINLPLKSRDKTLGILCL